MSEKSSRSRRVSVRASAVGKGRRKVVDAAVPNRKRVKTRVVAANSSIAALEQQTFQPGEEVVVEDHGQGELVWNADTGRLSVAIPSTRQELRAWIEGYFGIRVPDRAFCPGHCSPMDYIERSFLLQRDLLVWANRGGGKTYLAAVATLLDGLRDGLKINVLGGSFDQSDRLADYVRDLLGRHPTLIDGRMTHEKVRLKTGSVIQMLSQSQTAVRGQHVQKIRCDEVDLFDSAIWRAVQFTTKSRGQTRGSIEVLSTLHRSGGLMQSLVEAARSRKDAQAAQGATQPDGGFELVQWCLWEVIERCPETRQCGQCPLCEDCRGTARNADGFFSIDDAIAIKLRSSKAAWEAEMLCLGARGDYLVFPEFDPNKHVAPVSYLPDWPLYRAIDFGWRSPMVCLWIQETPGGFIHVIDEYFAQRVALVQHAEAILRRDKGPAKATYVDPAGNAAESTSGASCTDTLQAKGIPCLWRRSSIVEGLELIRCALSPASGPPAVVISPRCTNLIRAFQEYHYPPPEAGGDPDKPMKDGPDHFLDALRYFFVNRARPTAKVRTRTY